MGRNRLFLLILIAAVLMPLAAQAELGVFAPFVSRLDGEVRDKLVHISWLDSRDARGPVYVYRSTVPFDGLSSLSGIQPVEVPYGVQSFVDSAEEEGTYYYFVAASSETGRRYDIMITSGNTIGVMMSLPAAAPAEIPVVRAWDGISSLTAAPLGERIIITFSAGSIRSAALYRSVRPIVNVPDLLGAVIVQTRVISPFTDYPVPGIPYYYAVISEDDLIRGTVNILPGQNATRSPVIAQSGEAQMERDIRVMPLPALSAGAATAGGTGALVAPPTTTELSAGAARALESIPPRQPADPHGRRPRVFARDLGAHPAGSEDFALASIINGSFTERDWQTAAEELERFLALPRSAEVRNRARFYLGQSYYFSQRPRDGLFEFLAIQERYPAETMEWIQASLEMMNSD